jgi:transmembrane sensor
MNQQVYEEASEWLVEFRTGLPDQSTRKRFERWLSTSPEHVRAYLEQSSVWEAISAQQPAERHELDALIERARESSAGKVVPLAPPQVLARSAGAGRDSRWSSFLSRRRALLATAATLLLTVLGVSGHFYAARNVYSTAIGEQRSILLSDGSTIDLNARSRVRVRLDKYGRHVDLIEGQALFRVAKDKKRPFIVASNGTRVRAVGTQFDINQRKGGLIVTVVEGTVAVSGPVIHANDGGGPKTNEVSGASVKLPVGAPGSPAKRLARNSQSSSAGSAPARSAISAGTGEILLDAGQQLTLSAIVPTAPSAQPQPTPRAVDIESATAWTQRRLIFESTPLEDVTAEFNRNSERALIISGHGLDDFHVSGAFSSTDVQPFLRFLRAQNGVEVIEEPERIIITHR